MTAVRCPRQQRGARVEAALQRLAEPDPDAVREAVDSLDARRREQRLRGGRSR